MRSINYVMACMVPLLFTGVSSAENTEISDAESQWLLQAPVVAAPRVVLPQARPAPRVAQPQPRTAPYIQNVSFARKAPVVRPRLRSNMLRQLPFSTDHLLRSSKMTPQGLSVFVLGIGDREPLMVYKENQPRVPASVMKLVTTYSALGVLGPNYRWQTHVYMQGNIQGGTLNGNLIVKGFGAPDFKTADLRTVLKSLRQKGVRNFNGKIIFDNSYFQKSNTHAGAFDGKPYAAYNAQPDALMFNGRVSEFIVQNVKGRVAIYSPAPASNVKVVNKIRSVRSRCRGRARSPRMSISSNAQGHVVTFSGRFSKRCGKRVYKNAVTDPSSMIFASMVHYWKQDVGGNINAQFVQGTKPANARLLVQHHSAPLHQIIREVNKESDNLMARQILLTIGAKKLGAPSNTRKGEVAVKQWLHSRGLNFPELRIENGSGLSRWAKISARHIGELLLNAYRSPFRQYLMNSLAVAGVDGTMKRRLRNTEVKGRGYFKTGTLKDARSIAGYVKGRDGKLYIVSILHNDPAARTRGRKAHDQLISWAYWGGHPPQNLAKH